MDTPTAILVSQIPLVIVVCIAIIEVYKFRKALEKILEKLDSFNVQNSK